MIIVYCTRKLQLFLLIFYFNEILISNFVLIQGLRLFGESYSGLEYDYKGLCNVYEYLNDTEKYLEYSHILETWRIIREGNLEVNFNFNILKPSIFIGF